MSKIQAEIKKLDYTKTTDESDNQTALMNIIARDENNNRIHITNDEHRSYFYVPTEEVDDNLRYHDRVYELERTDEDGERYKSVKDVPLTKVYTYIPGDVPKVRGDYTHYEADILFPNRFSLDTDIYGGIEVPEKVLEHDKVELSLDEIEPADFNSETRIVYCDIEVNDRKGFPDEEKAEEEIVCLTLYDSFEETYRVYLYHDDNPSVNPESKYAQDINVEVYDDEVDMLSAFADKLTDIKPDVISGWNFKKFDAMYLISRFDNLDGLDSEDLSPLSSAYNDGWFGGKIKGMSVFDMLKAYKNLQFTELDSFSLEDVAREELDIGKLEKEDQSIYKMWTSDLDTLLEYNIRDVYLTVELERTQDIIKFYEEVANFVGGRLTEVVDFSKAADIYVLRVVNDMFAVPSMDTVADESEEFEGAEVFDPVSEIKDMISVLDLASLYPFSMKTLNAGPRTKDPDGEITAPNGVSFTTETKSIISDIIDNLLDERELKKELRAQYSPDTREYTKYDLQQTAVKVLMNTLYGVLGWDRFRLYDEDVAAAVTATGREVIKFTEEKVNEMGYEVVYGDTDSVMLEFEDAQDIQEVIYTSFRIEEYINERYDEFAANELNVDEHYFDIEFEKIYRRYLQAGKKKRYAGHVIWKDGKETDSIDIVGLEFQRSDYSPAAKILQERVVNDILMGKSKQEIGELIRQSIEDIKNLNFELDELGIPGGISKQFSEYESKTKHVKGAEYANKNLGEQIQPGDKPKGIYVKRIPSYPSPPQLSDSAFICWMNSSNVPDSTVFDWDKYLDIQVHNPLSTLFESTQWGWGEMVSGEDQKNLGEFNNGESDDDMSVFDTSADLSNKPSQSQSASTHEDIETIDSEVINEEEVKTIADSGIDEFESGDDMSVFETKNELNGDTEEDDSKNVETLKRDDEQIEVIDFNDQDTSDDEEENNEENESQADLSYF